MSDISIAEDRGARSLKELSVYGQRFGAKSAGGQYSSTRQIPRPYPTQRFVWDPRKDISRLPSAIVGSSPTPAKRALHPQRISIDCGGTKRSSSDFRPQSSDILLSGTPKARRDALRMTPFMNQLKISKGFPIVGALRSKLVQTIQRR